MPMRRGLFIAGTDTEVGKTWVAAVLARLLRDDGLDLGVWKPVQSGCLAGDPRADSYQLRTIAGVDDPENEVCPFSFPVPLTPLLAAQLAGVELTLPGLLAGGEPLFARHEAMLVEGAGGLLAPLTREALGIDLIAALGLPVLLVARPGLGTINQTLLSIEALRRRDIPVAGVVFNGYRGELPPPIARLEAIVDEPRFHVSEASNPFLVERFGRVPVLGTIPWFAAPPSVELARRVRPYLDMTRIRSVFESTARGSSS